MLATYSMTCDDGRFDEFALLFAADAEFHVMGQVHRGRDAIVAFMEEALPPERRGRHMTSSSLIDIDESGDRARGLTDYVFVGRAGGQYAITSVGRYHDDFVRDRDGEWRFSRREIVFADF